MEMNLYGYKCKKCGQLHYPYRMVCKKCKRNAHNEFDLVPLPKNGKLLTFTHLYTLPADFEVAKLTLGIVELENGIRVTGQVSIQNPHMGMQVKGKIEAVRQEGYDTNYGIVFYEV